MLVQTVDICLEGCANIPVTEARDLVEAVDKYFCGSDGFDAEAYFRTLPEGDQVLTTNYADRTKQGSPPERNALDKRLD